MKVKWVKIKRFLSKNKWYLSIFLVIFLFLFFVEPGHAAGLWDSFVGAIGSAAKGVANGILSAFVVVVYYLIFIPITYLIAIAMWILIEVASFQYFINVPAVVDGWILMRDLVNMMFVMYLLYLAFTTILSLSKDFSKTLIKLILLVILVNFSRMIVGMLIDVSQIVMLTFVNGFRNVAGGNLLNGLGIKDVVNNVATLTTGSVAQTNFIKLALGIFAGLLVLSTLAMMVAFFILRVVKLWILTIMSPLMAIGFLFSGLQQFTSKWKKEFSDNLLGGPFMAFYLWLSLTIIGTTGEETALTTPTGSMADQMGSLGDEKLVTTGVFRMAIGAGILFASFDMAKGMAGQAGKIGDKVFGVGKSAAFGGIKKVGKMADTGLRLASTRAFGRDLSVGGIKRYGIQKGKEFKARWDTFEKRQYDVGRLKRQKKLQSKTKDTRKYQEMGVQAGQAKKGAEKLGTKIKGLEVAKDTISKKASSEESLNSILSAQSGKVVDESVISTNINKLKDSGILNEAEAEKLESSFLSVSGEEGKMTWGGGKDSEGVLQKLEQEKQTVSDAKSLQAVLSDDDATALDKQEALEKYGGSLGLTDESKAVLVEEGGSIQQQLESARKEKRKFKDKQEDLELAQRQMVMRRLLKDKQSAGHRVVRNRSVESKKEVRSFLKEKYEEIDNPDEISSFLSDATPEERNYLLEKSKDDLSEVLDSAGYQKDLDGLKSLFAKKISLSEPEKAEIEVKFKGQSWEQLVDKLGNGRATEAEEAVITEKLNDKLTKSDWDTIDVLDKQNRKTNAALSYGVTLKPDGVHRFKTDQEHYDLVVDSYKRGKIPTKAITPFLTQKDKKEGARLTEVGFEFLVTHNREVGKDAFSDEMGKDVIDALQNQKEEIRKYIEELNKTGIISGDINNKGNYNPKKPQSNLAYHMFQNIEKAATTVKSSKRDQMIEIAKNLTGKTGTK